MITTDLISHVMPNNPDPEVWANLLAVVLPEYGIDTPERIAAFLSQTAHESMDYRALSENLNYGATGLLNTFRKYFNQTTAQQYARKPQAIASRVYANRMGNGDEASGEGWKFRGRGILQVTGRNNYYQCSQFIFGDDRLLDNPELLEFQEYALRSACWYWTNNNLNAIADTGDVEALTRRINGGTNGLDDRTERYNTAISYLTE